MSTIIRPHHCQQERRHRFGELVQMDGSHHSWIGTEKSCLMNMVDDATGLTLARLFPEETTEGAMRTLWNWIDLYGIPQALYVDRKTVYVTSREPTIEEELAGESPLTAFGKACQKLGITLIKAWSPQAKGRVERSHAVYQDRLFKELKLQQIQNLSEANHLLTKDFCEELNQRFHLIPFLGDKPLDKIDDTDVEHYKKKRQDDGVSTGTINRELAVLSHLFTKAVEWKWLNNKPAVIKKFKENQHKITYLNVE
ncbi:MAG: DDE-type integrase/transposase/recombinase [Proteobacteria bacterium]|nr:DDE-type integrase/transposase/recombinase [Pseudomonadota bacterium]